MPWKPHIGLSVELVSEGSQLLTRFLDLPVKLPWVSKPGAAPVPGSKSSAAKAKRAVEKQTAKEARNSRFKLWFSDGLELERERAREGQGFLEDADTGVGGDTASDATCDEGEDPWEGDSEDDPWAAENSFARPAASPAAPDLSLSVAAEGQLLQSNQSQRKKIIRPRVKM